MKMKSKSLYLLALASALGLWVVLSMRQPYIATVTPDQFQVIQPWNGDLFTDTAGEYPGDPGGYYYTNDYGNSPSGDD